MQEKVADPIEYEQRLLIDVLALAGVRVTVSTVATWNERQCKDAKNWAISERLVQAGQRVKADPMPAFLAQHFPAPPAAITPRMMTRVGDKRPSAGERILLLRAGDLVPFLARYTDRGHGYSLPGRIIDAEANDDDLWISVAPLLEVRRG